MHKFQAYPHGCMGISVSIIILIIIQITNAIDTVFLTTLTGFESGNGVLTTANPITSNGFDSSSTTLPFTVSFSSTPQIAIGLDYLQSSYQNTLGLDTYMIDLSLTSASISSLTVKLNRTTSTITLININYLIIATDSFMDVVHTILDLQTTPIFTSTSSIQRNEQKRLNYRSKSNSTNAVVIYSTIGIYMVRNNTHTFNYEIATTSLDTSSYNVSIIVGGYNRIKWVRICSVSYERIATNILPPFYLDLGILTSLSGSFSDTSGVSVSNIGIIWTGMTDWLIDDTNGILNYNLQTNQKTYTLTSTSLSRSRTSYLWYRKQSCQNYYYLNDHSCQPCHYSCVTCSATTNTSCLSCPATRTYSQAENSCKCQTGYTDVGSSPCTLITCSDTCFTCANLNQCGSCHPSLGRQLILTECKCKDYKYDSFLADGDAYCFPCHQSCLHCSLAGVQTACTECNLAKDHRTFRESNHTCFCIDRYYNIPNQQVCGNCQYSCATCTGLTTCTTCNATLGRIMNTTSNLCNCSNGYYDNKLVQTCVTCPISCLTCSSGTVCLTCPSSRAISATKNCQCKSGYFQNPSDIQKQCQQCHHSCSTCTQSTTCGSCNNTLNRLFLNDQCLCPQYYYDDGVNQQCYICHFACVTCTNNQQTSCLTCNALKFRQISLNNQCICMDGHYQLNSYTQLCQNCYYTCQTCNNGGANACLSCNSAKYRTSDGNGLCLCQDGYWDNGNQLCQLCYYRCLTCSSLNSCDTCDSNTRDITNLALCLCLQGFYDDGHSKSCIPCQQQCLGCSNGNNCTSCTSNKLLTITKHCQCASRTYQPYCLACSYQCQQCLSTADNCIKCNSTAKRYLTTSPNTCKCYEGYFSDGSTQQCGKCHYSCKSCSAYSSCDACPTNRVPNGAYCSCVTQFYQNPSNLHCLACHYSCQQCSSFSICTTCNAVTNHRILPTTPLLTTLCVCSDGYYDNLVGQLCFSCDSSCLKCTSYPACTACDLTKHRHISNTQCICIDGYYQNPITFECQICQYSCQTCDDGTTCISCPSDRTFNSDTNLCDCLSSTFDDPNTNTCQPCSYPCAQCQQTTSKCTNCLATFQYQSSPNLCKCPIKTFQQPLLQQCSPCKPQCVQCISATTCSSCNLNFHNRQLINQQCQCINGYHDDDQVLTICLACHYSCATCSNSTSCATCKSNRIISGTSLYCSCPVTLYYDDGSNYNCLRCADKCLSCKGTSTNCTSCSTANHRSHVVSIIGVDYYGSCPCNTNYYDNSGAAMCSSCHYSCQTCAGISTCDSCNSAKGRVYVAGPYCDCLSSKFDQVNQPTCQTCDKTCLTCTSTSTHCLTCQATRTYVALSSTCPCISSYYAPSPPAASCLPCPYSCTQCLSEEQCTQCPSSRLISTTNKCDCINHYYNVDDILDCQQCYPLCLECSTSIDYCTSCDTPTTGRILLNNQCICQDGWHSQFTINQNINCLKCHYSCERCESSTRCTSCSDLAERLYDVSTQLCKCQDGFFDDSTNQDCSACPFDCEKCSDQNTCLTCRAQREPTGTPMRCQCIASTYQDGTSCQQCPPECTQCSSLSFCLECYSPRTLSATNQCQCPTNTYPVPSSPNCVTCQYSCKTCKSGTSCTSCDSSKNRFISGGFCKCKNKYYDDLSNQLCKTCQYSCLTCSKANQCLTCDSSLQRVYNPTNKICVCTPGYYEDTQSCVKCHYTCKTCSGGTVNDCLSCSTLYQRTLIVNSQANTKICECKQIGFFNQNTKALCGTCDVSCLTCSTTATRCNSCDTVNNFRNLNVNSCQCSIGYYEYNSQPVCAKCSYKCVKCEASETQCTQCDPTKSRDTATLPSCNCQGGYYDDGSNSICQNCSYKCLTCKDGNSCETCDNSINHRQLSAVTGFCQCQNTYYDQGNQDPQCIKCDHSCLTCNHPTICISCPATRYFNTGFCYCNVKFYDDNVSSLCLPCDYSCQSCTNSTQCAQCSSSAYRKFDQTTLKCSCKRGYYDTGVNSQQCLTCDKSCYSCTNSTHCQSCYSGSNTTLNATSGSNYCVCKYSMYISSPKPPLPLVHLQIHYCSFCHYSCQKCYSESYHCTQCDSAAHRSLSLLNQCLCVTGYYDDGTNQLCIACDDTTNCLRCFGSNQNQCLQCKSGVYMLSGSCYPSCPDYYYENDPTWSCKTCLSYCTKCDNGTLCNQCQVGFFIMQPNNNLTDGINKCTDVCPNNYYQNGTNCLPCLSPCLRCTDKYVCIDCIQSYYLNVQCFPCYSSCRFCTGGSPLNCISCTQGYYLNNVTNLCVKATCSATQYVHGIYGCYSCKDTYPNSIGCNATGVSSCSNGYKVKNGSCVSCAFIQGFTVVDNKCQQVCGDGIKFTYLCDDGNTLDGDGCSSSCSIENNWQCTSLSVCKLKIIPEIQVQSITKVRGSNKINIILTLNVGLRLYTKNFYVTFVSGMTNFNHSLSSLNTQLTRYLLVIQYFETIAHDQLRINVRSPSTSISRRMLQDIQLAIDIQLQIQLDVITNPPAIYYPEQTRTSFGSIVLYIFLGLHLVLLLLILLVILYFRLKLLLPIIEAYSFIRCVYLYLAFGLFDVIELSSQSAIGLRPYTYFFGTPLTKNNLSNTNSSEFDQSSVKYYEFTQFMLSICIIQIVILGIVTTVKLYYSTKTAANQNRQQNIRYQKIYNYLRYLQFGLLYTFSYQIILACIYTYKWLPFNGSFQTSYSWGFAIILIIVYLTSNWQYIIYANRHHRYISKIYPCITDGKSSQISDMESVNLSKKGSIAMVINNTKIQQAEDNQNDSAIINRDPFDDPFAEQQNGTQANIMQKQERSIVNQIMSENKTQANLNQDNQSQSKQSQNQQDQLQLVPLYDLTPKNASSPQTAYNLKQKLSQQQFYHNKILHPYYLPVFNILSPIIICIFIFINNSIARCIVLSLWQIGMLITFILMQKFMGRIWVFRTLKNIIFIILLFILSLLGSILAITNYNNTILTDVVIQKQMATIYSIEIAIIVITGLSLIFSIISFIISVVKSDEFRIYQLKKKNQAIRQKNMRKNRLRDIDGPLNNSNNNNVTMTPLRNIFGRKISQYQQYYQRTDTKINFRLDSQHQQNMGSIAQINGKNNNNNKIGLEIIDIQQDNNVQEGYNSYSPTKNRMRNILNYQNTNSQKNQLLNNTTENIKKKQKTSNAQNSNEKIRHHSTIQQIKKKSYNSHGDYQDPSSNNSRIGKIHSNSRKKQINQSITKQEQVNRKDYNKSMEMQEIQLTNNNNNQSTNMKSTRIQQPSSRLTNIPKKKDAHNKVAGFLSRLENQLNGTKDNDRTVIIKKHDSSNDHSDSRDNTLISRKQSIQKAQKNNQPQTKKNTHQNNLIPTHQYSQEGSEQIQQNLSNSSHHSQIISEQNEHIENNNNVKEIYYDHQQPNQQGMQQIVEDNIQQLQLQQKQKQKYQKNKKHYKYNLNSKGKKSKSKGKKLLKNRSTTGLSDRKEEIIPKQLKQEIKKRKKQEKNIIDNIFQHQQDQQRDLGIDNHPEKNQRVINFVHEDIQQQNIKKIKSKVKKQRRVQKQSEDEQQLGQLPQGIVKEQPKRKSGHNQIKAEHNNNEQQIKKQAKPFEIQIREQMGNILEKVDNSPVNKARQIKNQSPNKNKLKRIDSISSIGEEESRKIKNNWQSEIQKQQSEEMSEEGNTVFKKILHDYQKYKNKKVRGNPLRNIK